MYQYYFHRGTRRFALWCAIPVLVICALFLPFSYAIAAGAGVALAISLLFPLLLWLFDRDYMALCGMLSEPVHFRERIFLQFPKGGGSNACLYLCQEHLYLCAFRRHGLFWHKKEALLFSRIPRKCVYMIELQEHIGHMRLCFHDRLCYDFLCIREDELLSHLKALGWNIGQACPERG